MTTSKAISWDPKEETFQQFNSRKQREQAEAKRRRQDAALFRLAVAKLPWERYSFPTELIENKDTGKPEVHSYVLCRDCWKLTPGLVDPRTIVAERGFVHTLLPHNDDMAVGVEMLDVIRSLVTHEQEFHGNAPRKGF